MKLNHISRPDSYLGDEPSPEFPLKLGAAGIILIVSAVAASFPTLAKRAPRIEPPEIVFFIAKHFGTGVILATAFVHLLQEAFESLNHPSVSGGWKELTGLLVLLSLLSIFLLEYVSNAIVERMSGRHPHGHHHHFPTTSSVHDQNHNHNHSHEHEHDEVSEAFGSRYYDEDGPEERQPLIEGDTTITATARPADTERSRRSHISLGHHRHESPHAHHHKATPRLIERQHIPILYIPEPAQGEVPVCIDVHFRDHHSDSVDQQEISRKTRIISILVLQLGIMVHSVVIGLTLAITEGAGFTTLLTAVVFHQLFEGLSLGIRISTLPDNSGKHRLLPTVLCGLFAITAPLGLLLGIAFFPASSPRQEQLNLAVIPSAPPALLLQPDSGFPIYHGQLASDSDTVLLIRGLMCSLSAGMLIYASAVEMLAGDFVMSAELRQLSWGKQAIALISLILGTCAMAIIGMWTGDFYPDSDT